MTAEVHHGRLELAQLAEQIERPGIPPGLQFEAIPVAAPFKFHLDRPRFFAERERASSGRIGSEKQNGVLLHGRSRRRGLLRWGRFVLAALAIADTELRGPTIGRRPIEKPDAPGGVTSNNAPP